MDKPIDIKHLEKNIEAQTKAIERHTDALKQSEKTLSLLVRQMEKLTNVIATGNELRRHGGNA